MLPADGRSVTRYVCQPRSAHAICSIDATRSVALLASAAMGGGGPQARWPMRCGAAAAAAATAGAIAQRTHAAGALLGRFAACCWLVVDDDAQYGTPSRRNGGHLSRRFVAGLALAADGLLVCDFFIAVGRSHNYSTTLRWTALDRSRHHTAACSFRLCISGSLFLCPTPNSVGRPAAIGTAETCQPRYDRGTRDREREPAEPMPVDGVMSWSLVVAAPARDADPAASRVDFWGFGPSPRVSHFIISHEVKRRLTALPASTARTMPTDGGFCGSRQGTTRFISAGCSAEIK
jgi:hypothetical protein